MIMTEVAVLTRSLTILMKELDVLTKTISGSLRDAIEIVSRLDDRPPAPPGYDLLYDRDGKPKLRTFFFLLPCIAVGFLLCSFEPVLDVVGYVLVTLGCTGLVGWVIESLLFQTGCRR